MQIFISRIYISGLTIIDSLDTLFLMGLKDELKEAADFVSTVNFKYVHLVINYHRYMVFPSAGMFEAPSLA